MADFAYNTGTREWADNTIDLTTDAIRFMLCGNGYTADRDDDVVDAAGANDPVDEEVSGTGYTGGWGGSGRKALSSPTWTTNKTNDRVEFDAADITWSAIDVSGGGAGQPTQALMILKGTSDDTDARLITHHDFAVTTNGGDVTMQISDIFRILTT